MFFINSIQSEDLQRQDTPFGESNNIYLVSSLAGNAEAKEKLD